MKKLAGSIALTSPSTSLRPVPCGHVRANAIAQHAQVEERQSPGGEEPHLCRVEKQPDPSASRQRNAHQGQIKARRRTQEHLDSDQDATAANQQPVDRIPYSGVLRKGAPGMNITFMSTRRNQSRGGLK